ncbi:alpha/beta hydrolase [Actinophytocola oryzae]|uniref:Alpha/beta hydrolase family protein n=1 Tax=Actinophytocola oryzae TaxID=502181 RepID=A0A4R7VYK3_9PSEU|nr:alpha/beta hydrolase [Actinophytocola oryzae]TDV55112.1 alpha/beta hydrolase family protein [Actinophytocola oryzae]
MRKRGALAVLASALLGTGLVATPATAAPAPAAIDWQPCGEDAPGVDCATIEVPLDYSRPHGQKIHLGLAKRPATDPAARIGSVLVDPGGPGGSGVAFVMGGDTVSSAVAARFDQIGFDPRGINTSSRLLCDVDLSQQVDAAKHPTSQAEFDRLATLNRALHDSCRANSGGLAEHVDNLNTARDMDAIRVALGERKLTFVGYSYGSLMGQQYAELFGRNVRALVMDGNMDHSLRTAWDFARTETAPVEEGFVEFARWCDTTPSCALYGMDTTKTYLSLKAKAKAGTLVDPDGNKVDFYDLAGGMFSVVQPQAWSFVAENLRWLLDGTGSPEADATALAEIDNDPYPPIWCSDWRYPVRNYAEYAGIRAGLTRAYPIMEWSPYVDHAMTCVNSGTRTTNPQRPLHVDNAPPLVMLGNLHDPATVYPWSVAAARQSGARLVTYEGWGHTVYATGVECVDTVVDDYLINLRPPRRGVSCASVDEPALASASRNVVPDGRY